MHIRLIRQHDETDCGVACLAMILARYRTTIPISRLRQMAGTDNEGTTAFGIKTCAETLGLRCDAIEANAAIWTNKRLVLPLIAHIVLNNGLQHFVVVYGLRQGKLLIADPGSGKYKVSVDEFSNSWTGVLLLFKTAHDYVRTVEKEAGLKSFLPMLLNQKRLIAKIILTSVVLTIFGVAGSYYFQLIIDDFVPSGMLNTLNLVSIALVVMYIFQGIFEYGRTYLLTVFGQKMSVSIMLKYIKHVLHLPMSFFATRRSGEIVSRFLDANKIIDALASATLSLFLDVGMVVVLGVTLYFQNPVLFLITSSTIPLYALIVIIFIKGYNRANETEMQAGAVLNSSIIESLKGIETIKAYNAETKVYKRIDHEFVDLMRSSFKRANLDDVQRSLKLILRLLNTAVVLWVGSKLVIQGSMSIGQLITFNALSSFFTTPLQSIINLQVKMQTARVANHRLNEIFYLDEEPTVSVNRCSLNQGNVPALLTVHNVDFAYGLKLPVIKSVSMQVASAEKIAIVGMSGSGKSTLAKLMVNFYQPCGGSINLDGINIQHINRSLLRRYITYVPQDSFFFSGTILENLTFGLEAPVELNKVVHVCELVQMMDFINSLPQRLYSRLDEGAGNLSGGQKQRLAIARALLTNAKIVIFDEATSGLDAALEHQIVHDLLGMQNLTLIFIAHRLSIAKSCDRIFVLEDGRVVQAGSHDELIDTAGTYQNLWKQS